MTLRKKTTRKTPPKKSKNKSASRPKQKKVSTKNYRAPKKRANSKPSSIKKQLNKSFAGLIILLVLVIAAAVVSHQIFTSRSNDQMNRLEISRSGQSPLQREKSSTVRTSDAVSNKKSTHYSEKKMNEPFSPEKSAVKKPVKSPTFEIFPENDFPNRKRAPGPANETHPKKRPKVAIIIDDLGYDIDLADKLVRVDSEFSFSVIPYSPHYKRVAKMVRKNGGELMLHLPMEPLEYPEIEPGPGALLAEMTPDELLEQLNENLDAVPGIQGVNGHMGSRLTANSDQMNQVFSILKRKNLFFIDSYTTPESVCMSSARLLKVPFARRDVFIDHVQDAKAIRRQIELLVELAQRNGEAVGIIHPYIETIEVLKEMLPELKKKVDLTPVSNLTKILG